MRPRRGGRAAARRRVPAVRRRPGAHRPHRGHGGRGSRQAGRGRAQVPLGGLPAPARPQHGPGVRRRSRSSAPTSSSSTNRPSPEPSSPPAPASPGSPRPPRRPSSPTRWPPPQGRCLGARPAAGHPARARRAARGRPSPRPPLLARPGAGLHDRGPHRTARRPGRSVRVRRSFLQRPCRCDPVRLGLARPRPTAGARLARHAERGRRGALLRRGRRGAATCPCRPWWWRRPGDDRRTHRPTSSSPPGCRSWTCWPARRSWSPTPGTTRPARPWPTASRSWWRRSETISRSWPTRWSPPGPACGSSSAGSTPTGSATRSPRPARRRAAGRRRPDPRLVRRRRGTGRRRRPAGVHARRCPDPHGGRRMSADHPAPTPTADTHPSATRPTPVLDAATSRRWSPTPPTPVAPSRRGCHVEVAPGEWGRAPTPPRSPAVAPRLGPAADRPPRRS